MFVYYFTNVSRPCEGIGDRLGALDLETWATEAYRNAEALRSRLVGNDLVASSIRLHVTEPIHKSSHTLMVIEWTADGPAGLFAALEGDLVVAPIGPNRCQISLRGSYRLPPGADPSLFHRLTEACVKSFVDRVAAGLDQSPSRLDVVRQVTGSKS
jgi:hypothetical protein